MTPRTPWFPSLGAEAALADVQVRQTLAMGLVPLGIALLLMAAGAPDWPAPGLWTGAGAAIAGMALLWGLWRKSGRRHLKGYSTTHFLVRYLFIVLCPGLLWLVFGATILEMAGWLPPVLMGLLVLLYPVGRMLHERIGADVAPPPRIEKAYLAVRQAESLLGILALAGMVSGAILDAHRNYPTDPTPALILVWLLATIAILVSVVIGLAQGGARSGPPRPPQRLDDEPPPASPAQSTRFGSDRF